VSSSVPKSRKPLDCGVVEEPDRRNIAANTISDYSFYFPIMLTPYFDRKKLSGP
jgi:hypothetical protein